MGPNHNKDVIAWIYHPKAMGTMDLLSFQVRDGVIALPQLW
jgi:hypothetical protein